MKHHANYFKYLVKFKSFFNLTNAEKISKQKKKKNEIYIKEFEKIVAKMEVKLVTKKEKMREKLKKNELMSVHEDNNTNYDTSR